MFLSRIFVVENVLCNSEFLENAQLKVGKKFYVYVQNILL